MFKLFATTLFSILLTTVFSQEMKVKFSEKMSLKLGKDGYIKSFLGETEDYIYVSFQSRKANTKNDRIVIEKIGVFDKKSMKEVNSLTIIDEKNKARTAELDGKTKQAVKFVDDQIFVFYSEESKTEMNVFGEVYSLNLDKSVKMTKLFKIPKSSKREVVFPLISNNKSKFVVSRFDTEKDDEIKFYYSVFDFELNELISTDFILPEPDTKGDGTFSVNSIYFDNFDNIYFNQTLTIKAGEKRTGLFLKTNSYKYESFVTALSVETGDAEILEFSAENKSLINTKIIEDKQTLKLVGFFSDFEKDPNGIRTHGFFFCEIDPKQFDISEIQYSYFDKKLIDELFKSDEEDKLKTTGKKKSAADEAKLNQDALSRSFVIENVKVDDAGNMILFCSKMHNYSYEHCTTDANGRTSCRTVYVCDKSNVTVFKINPSGEFLWCTNVDRSTSYGGWNIYDLKVIEDGENYYVSYGSSYDMDATEKTKKSKKSVSERFDSMEYASFNKETGENEKHSVVINAADAKKSERKTCSPTEIQVFNNQFYLISRNKKLAPWVFATCLCPPAFLILGIFTQSGQMQESYIGRIELVD